MKRIHILYMMLLVNTAMYAQASYKIAFDKNDFTFEQNRAVEIVPKRTDYFLMEDTLQPALPYTTCNILIPKNSKIKDFSVNIKREVIMKNVIISSCPKVLPTNAQKTNKEPIDPVYSKKLYPEKSAVFTTENRMKGYSFAGFIISPFIYDAESKELSFITEITLSLQLEDSLVQPNYNTQQESAKNDLKNIVINPEALDVLYPVNTAISGSSSSLEVVEYLVVTSNALMEYFNPLITWKIKKGIRSKILSLEEIYANYSGANNQLKIKNCLRDYYENYQLKWVLLGGDNTVVPVQGCYGSCSGYTDETIPCDLFYACYDNAFDWNANGNNIIGELDDNVDLNPEIYISRLPIRVSAQITAFVNKLLKYEQQPATSSYVKKMLLAGTQLWNTWDGQSDAHQRSEKMYNDYIVNVWNGVKYRFYDTGTDFTGDASYDLSSSNLQTQINNGYHFLHMATHGLNTTWSMETGSSYSSTNASALQNANASIIATMACYTNAFDQTSDPCLSEAFIRNPNGACIAYWGSSRYGWGYSNLSANLGPSFQYDAYFYSKLFNALPALDSYKLAAVTAVAKQQFVSSSSYYGSFRWLQYALNTVGDPEMPIFTENPLSFSNPTVSQNGTSVTVNTGGISGCTIALTSKENGESYFEVARNVSSYTFTGVTLPCNIVISKHNYIPFTGCSQVAVNFTDQTVTANTTVIGCDVNVRNVTVTNGAKLTLDATGETVIESNFEVQLGSQLEIK